MYELFYIFVKIILIYLFNLFQCVRKLFKVFEVTGGVKFYRKFLIEYFASYNCRKILEIKLYYMVI